MRKKRTGQLELKRANSWAQVFFQPSSEHPVQRLWVNLYPTREAGSDGSESISFYDSTLHFRFRQPK